MPSRGHETVPKTAIPNVPSTMAELPIDLDRVGRKPLTAQIYAAIRVTIETGRLGAGARLPVLAPQFAGAELSISPRHRARGLRTSDQRAIRDWHGRGRHSVAERPSRSSTPDWSPEAPPLSEVIDAFAAAPFDIPDGRVLPGRLPLQTVVPHPQLVKPGGLRWPRSCIRIRAVSRTCERRSRLTWP